MTVKEKMREMFGITFQCSDSYNNSMISCLDMPCSKCPLKTCDCDGINEWLESEYTEEKKGDENNQIETKDYQKGFEDGKAQVINDLSKIFLRR